MAFNQNEDLMKKRDLANEFSVEFAKREEDFLKGCSEEQAGFIENIHRITPYNLELESGLARKLLEGLITGKYKKPSEFFESEMDYLFNGYIFPRFKKAFLYAVDNRIKYQYSFSWYRRSFRTSDYSMHIYNVLDLTHRFHTKLCFDRDLCDVLENKIPEKEQAYAHKYRYSYMGYNAEVIAYELDNGNSRLEEIITDIIMGEGETVFDNEIIKGIVQSENHKMHEFLGKLLLSARLQEGLRQAVCEKADAGTVTAFLEILKVIDENNLIRFSAIKRAVGTWLGLISDESNNLDRISGKSLKLIKECLEDEEKQKEYLDSEDSMEIYIALWSYGFYEVNDAVELVYRLAENGTNHQLLTSGYFIGNLDNGKMEHDISKKVISIRNEEMNVLAVFLPHIMKDWGWSKSLDKYYQNESEAEKYYDIFLKIYNLIPKKSLDFSPCIFPWHSASLTKSDVVIRLCLTSRYIKDTGKKDFACGLIKECDRDYRAKLLKYMLDNPGTPVQKKILTNALCDKETQTRTNAFEIIKEIPLDAENYLQMEEMLKYKAADMRANLITLLYGQSDDMLYGTVERLIADKKEEKRTAALDLIMKLSSDEGRKDLFDKCRILAEGLTDVSTKENILLENIIGSTKCGSSVEVEELFTDEDIYLPEMPDNQLIRDSISLYMEYFPDSNFKEDIKGGKADGNDDICSTAAKSLEDLKSLSELINTHRNDEYVGGNGETRAVGYESYLFVEKVSENKFDIPLLSLWQEWYRNEIASVHRLLRMWVHISAYSESNIFTEKTKKYIRRLYGNGFENRPSLEYMGHMYRIIERLIEIYFDNDVREKLAIAVACWYINSVPEDEVVFDAEVRYPDKKYSCLITHLQIAVLLSGLKYHNDKDFETLFNIGEMVSQKTYKNVDKNEVVSCRVPFYGAVSFTRFAVPDQYQYIVAAFRGIITEKMMYRYLFDKENIAESLKVLTLLVSIIRDGDRQVTERNVPWWINNSKKNKEMLYMLVGKKEDFNEEDKRLLSFTDEIYEKMTDRILAVELKRGDSNTEYSEVIRNIYRVYGLDNFVAILSAFGKDTFERSAYSYYGSSGKKRCLSHLLGVCIPNEEDNAQKLKEMVKGTDITDKRLIEAALYSPEWIDIVGEYLGWEGFKMACYYFMAHMNENFDDKKKAVIARYTPLATDELNMGAFDLQWFHQSYKTLGEKRFQMIYDAAKYISDGSKHARARKYADAALGKLKVKDTEKTISEKRNKDLLMAYSLIPLKGEKDIKRRYLFLQKFLKESKKFGSQRIASEKKAVEISMSNLAFNAGYTDVMRLTLNMETKIMDESRELFEDRMVDDITIRLNVDEAGKVSIVCSKGGKELKSVPSRLNKNKDIAMLKEAKKRFSEQYSRTKVLFEQAMEDSTEFTVKEIVSLKNNPVVYPIVRELVFLADTKLGFLDDNKLTDYSGNVTELQDNDSVTVAHPFHLYKDGHWTEYQKNLFDREAVQPFKQVFRELYVKTDEEMTMNHSLRYSGNQIQPARTVACLKSRRWVADIEDGLQKVYYRENIVARIYAMADWFSPADIEAPTLEWVEFSDRKTGESITIEKIPDIIFSEVMRDVDLAVSVAHAGRVDPETSHSTIEMRFALISFTLPLFKIKNVTLNKNHALVEGKYGNYTIHLGSGTIHKQGGTMINVLPVHSQHRGKLFLPFADDDPKTAEIISKVLMFADDGKIKDPSILGQIK